MPLTIPTDDIVKEGARRPDITKSKEELYSIRVKNRRRRYLELHPEYFNSDNLESADPLLYDQLVRRFESATERAAQDKANGYARTLERHLVRSEAKIAAVAQSQQPTFRGQDDVMYARAPDGSINAVARDPEERVGNREEGEGVWRQVMTERFVRGEDEDFDYDNVDRDEGLDDRTDEVEEWFDREEEHFVGDGGPKGETGVLDY